MVWSHQSLGIKFHNNLPELGFHLTHEELLAGIGFNDNIAHNSENEPYAEMVMEHYHGYGCHCMPAHAHFIMTGGRGPPQDLLDVNCQLLRTCYSCAKIENDHCDAHNATYAFDLSHMVANDINNSITCRDAEGTCARRTCECDKHFAIHAAEHFYQWDENNHGLDFDRSTQCAPREGNGAQFENDCQREAHRTDIVEGLIPMKRPKEHTTKTSAVLATTTTLKTTTTTTATTTTTTTTTTIDEHWHTHPDVPQGHVHVTRPRKN